MSKCRHLVQRRKGFSANSVSWDVKREVDERVVFFMVKYGAENLGLRK